MSKTERRTGWVSIEDQEDDGGEWSGHICSYNPKGANLAWLDPVPFVELRESEVIVDKDFIRAILQSIRNYDYAHERDAVISQLEECLK